MEIQYPTKQPFTNWGQVVPAGAIIGYQGEEIQISIGATPHSCNQPETGGFIRTIDIKRGTVIDATRECVQYFLTAYDIVPVGNQKTFMDFRRQYNMRFKNS